MNSRRKLLDGVAEASEKLLFGEKSNEKSKVKIIEGDSKYETPKDD